MSEQNRTDDCRSIDSPVRILFLDGMGCNPEGFKPTFLRGLGYQVTVPMLPDLDFPQSVAVAERALELEQPDIVVGYSRGAGVAMSLSDKAVPRLLIAPALRYVADGMAHPGPVIVLHSETDDSLPLDSVQEHLRRIGLPSSVLRIVGEDHTMIDPPALRALEAGLEELVIHTVRGQD